MPPEDTDIATNLHKILLNNPICNFLYFYNAVDAYRKLENFGGRYSRGKCQENTIKFLENFFQTFRFGKLWVLPWETLMFYTINKRVAVNCHTLYHYAVFFFFVGFSGSIRCLLSSIYSTTCR